MQPLTVRQVSCMSESWRVSLLGRPDSGAIAASPPPSTSVTPSTELPAASTATTYFRLHPPEASTSTASPGAPSEVALTCLCAVLSFKLIADFRSLQGNVQPSSSRTSCGCRRGVGAGCGWTTRALPQRAHQEGADRVTARAAGMARPPLPHLNISSRSRMALTHMLFWKRRPDLQHLPASLSSGGSYMCPP